MIIVSQKIQVLYHLQIMYIIQANVQVEGYVATTNSIYPSERQCSF